MGPKLGPKECATLDHERPYNAGHAATLRRLQQMRVHPRDCEECHRRRASRLVTRAGVERTVCGVCAATTAVDRKLALLRESMRDGR